MTTNNHFLQGIPGLGTLIGPSPSPLVTYGVLVFATVGVLAFARFGFSLLRTLLDVTIRRGVNLNKFGAKKGAWALVTGCTDGIGKEFAIQLASKGFNILLVSRTQTKLEALAGEIEASYGIDTRTFAVDFARATDADYEKLRQIVDNIEITVLVNNVGISHKFPTPFLEEDESVIHDMITINISAQLRITRIVLPQMIERKNGLIINLSSFSAILPAPLLSVYTGTKSFMLGWSQALGQELIGQGILVQCTTPAFVVSSMTKTRRSLYVPSAASFVKSSLNQIGLAGGASTPFTSSPYPAHALFHWALDWLIPRDLALKRILAALIKTRKRALAKQAREAKEE